MAGTKTSALHAYVSAESFESWRHFAEENGVSVTGLLEALAGEIAQEIEECRDATLVRQDWVKAARRIDVLRRRRGRARESVDA
jgi:hypothetical protein